MSMIYREATCKDLEEIATLTALAFEDYPLFAVVRSGVRDEHGRDEAVYLLQRVEAELFLKHQVCLVGTQENKIVAAALIDSPHKKKISFLQYVRCGGLALFTKVGLARLRTFFGLAHLTVQTIEEKYKNSWYLDTLAIDPLCQGSGLGSKMIHEAINPYIAQQGGGVVTLITNTEINARFYLKNGFTQAEVAEVSYNGASMKNWVFVSEL